MIRVATRELNCMSIYSLIKRLSSFLKHRKKKRYIENLVKNGLDLGENVEIVGTFFFDPSHCYLVSIGAHSTICPNVRLIAHDASTKKLLGYTKIGRVKIGENCFVGDSVVVLPDVTIGPNSIIGAGAVVTKTIPPYSIAAGNPAKVICTLDEYSRRIKEISTHKKIFGKEYYIENLTLEKRKEIIESVEKSIGFIV